MSRARALDSARRFTLERTAKAVSTWTSSSGWGDGVEGEEFEGILDCVSVGLNWFWFLFGVGGGEFVVCMGIFVCISIGRGAGIAIRRQNRMTLFGHRIPLFPFFLRLQTLSSFSYLPSSVLYSNTNPTSSPRFGNRKGKRSIKADLD